MTENRNLEWGCTDGGEARAPSSPVVGWTGRLRGTDPARANLQRLRWRGVVLPVVFLAVVETLRFALFRHNVEGLWSLVFFFGVLTLGAAVFSHTVFRTIERLHERVVGQSRRLAALGRIALESAERPGLERLLDTALREAVEIVSADAGLICVVDLARNEHTAVAARGFSDELIRNFRRLPLHDDPIASEVVATGKPVAVPCLLDDPRIAALAAREGVRSSLSVPLKSQGEVAGVLAVATREERRFSEADRDFLLNVASQLALALKHATAFERALRTTRELEALVAVGSAATSSLNLHEVLDRALDAILGVTSAEAGEIWLTRDTDLELVRHRGAGAEAFHESRRLAFGEGLPGVAAQTRSPAVVRDADRDDRLVRRAVAAAGFKTYCALPLVHRGTLHGVLGVAARAADALSEREELRLLEAVAEVVSVAIDNARLHERVQDAAAIEERERLAREMHDGLAQVLTYLNAQSIAIHKLLSSNRIGEANTELAQMQGAVRDLYADVREAILGLRTSPRLEGGLISSVRGYLASFENMTEIRAELQVVPGAERVAVDSTQEIQAMRIIQEALANVRRHARARNVAVRFEPSAQGMRILVEDDGRGFDPEHVAPRGWPRFGLQTMRERAEAVGGSLRVLSRPGHGTTVAVELGSAARVRGAAAETSFAGVRSA